MKKLSQKIKILIDNKLGYILMKMFSRIFILKNIFLTINRFGQKKILNENFKTNKSVEISNSASINEIIRELHTNGFSIRLKLNDIYLNKILDYTKNSLCYAYGNPQFGFYFSEKEKCEKKIGKNILLAKYYNFQNKQPFADVSNSPVLNNIAKIYLGKNVKNIANQLWWTFPANVDFETKSKAAHYFHRDIDAWGFVKFFFYLNDVFHDGGPHVYIKKSHKPNLYDQIFFDKFQTSRHSDRSVRKKFKKKDICSIYGSAGIGFASDTFGLHKGTSPLKKPRLVLCCVYATEDYGLQDFKIKPEILKHYNN